MKNLDGDPAVLQSDPADAGDHFRVRFCPSRDAGGLHHLQHSECRNNRAMKRAGDLARLGVNDGAFGNPYPGRIVLGLIGGIGGVLLASRRSFLAGAGSSPMCRRGFIFSPRVEVLVLRHQRFWFSPLPARFLCALISSAFPRVALP